MNITGYTAHVTARREAEEFARRAEIIRRQAEARRSRGEFPSATTDPGRRSGTAVLAHWFGRLAHRPAARPAQ